MPDPNRTDLQALAREFAEAVAEERFVDADDFASAYFRQANGEPVLVMWTRDEPDRCAALNRKGGRCALPAREGARSCTVHARAERGSEAL